MDMAPEVAVYWSHKLIEASQTGALEEMEQAIANGADVNCQIGENHTSPLHRAVQSGSLEAVSLLLRHGAQCDIRTRKGYTPLHQASEMSQYDIAELLLDYGAQPNAYTFTGTTSPIGDTPLCFAAKRDAWQMVEILLYSGADPLQEVWHYSDGILSQSLPYSHQRVVQRLKEYELLPRPAAGEQITKARLLERDERGRCMLDNPLVWRGWDSISAALAEKGERLTREELFSLSGDGVTPYIQYAIESRSLHHVVRDLNRHGEYLEMEDLTLWFDVSMLERKHVVSALFTEENMLPQGRSGMRKNLLALSPEARELIPGLKMLSAVVSAYAPVAAGRS